MDYIRRVWSSLKNGVNADLTERTILVGANGSGKSAILQALELATLGQVSDVEGRACVKQPHVIARLFPAEADIFAEAKSASGQAWSWRMQRKADGGFKEPERHGIEVGWPLHELKTTLRGEAAGVRTWIEGEVSRPDFDVVLAQLPGVVRDEATKWSMVQKSKDVLHLASEAKKEARALRSEATKSLSTVDKMLVGVAPPLSAQARAELQHRIDGGSTGISAADHQLAEAQLVTHRHKRQLLLAQKRDVLSNKALRALSRVQADLNLIYDHNREADAKGCRVCGNSTPGAIVAREKALKEVQVGLSSQAAAFREQLQLDEAIGVLEHEIEGLEAKLRLPVVENTTKDAVMKLAQDDVIAKSWKNAAGLRLAAEDKRVRADRLTTLAEQLESVGRQFVEANKAEFETRVSRFLPNGLKFGIDLDAARVGFARFGQVHSALSGGEEGMVLLGLAAEKPPVTTPSILAPDDRGWDPVTLHSVMWALRDAPHQIIIMSTVMPEPVEGWSCLDLR